MNKLANIMQFKSTLYKNLAILVFALVLVTLFDLPKAFGAELDKNLAKQGIETEIKEEWLQGPSKEKSIKEEKINAKPKLIHHNGKPLKQNILEDAGDNHLIAVYQYEIDGKLYEKYYFSDTSENDIDAIKNDVIENTNKIETDSKAFIRELTKDNIQQQQTSGSISILAVQPEPSGGYYKTYSWNFTNPFTGLKTGTFTTTLHFDRKSYSANIDGVTGSVWDIKAFNEFEATYYRIDIQNSRMDVNYSAQKILSYGPYDDAGFDVGVNLTGITSGNAWTFNVGSVYTNNVSSIANKYGRWIWTHTWDYMQNPFVTRPGLRVSNTSGSLAIKTSHTFHTSYSYEHQTGIVTTYIPDR